MSYNFYGKGSAPVNPLNQEFSYISNQFELYELLSKCWCMETCAPRLRMSWSKENRTCGQCSITAFLVQDIFGGDVYGIPLGDGNFHCYNIVNGSLFDLTSEQFGDRILDYSSRILQSRAEHFAKQEKYERYLLLKERLKALPSESV